jgi:asparagine synthase (glutamine-hydrolysing)
MCGIAGAILSPDFSGLSDGHRAVERMCDAMSSRGPDAVGYWQANNLPVFLGHRRLSVIDLEARANQPFMSDCSNYTIVFNGEIYNFRELRSALQEQGEVFRTASDTEVILKLYIQYGVRMLARLRGMFAIAIWDTRKQTCFFARDPYGIKPLYVARARAGWLFASQVKALLASGLVSGDTDPLGEASFWMLGSVAGPRTWFQDISEIPPGSWAEIDGEGKFTGPESYWNIGESWSVAGQDVEREEVRERVRQALRESVKYHLGADVPVGVFLSGGIDSGALAGLMVECGARQLTGVTIAYEEFRGTHDDEAPIAARIARHYGIDHVVRRVTRAEFEADLPAIMASMDQPTIDGINTWYASKAVAETGLKVVVSGVGGDELFMGYDSFRQIPRLVKAARAIAQLPGGMALENLLTSLQAKKSGNLRWQHAPQWLQTIGGGWWLRRSTCAPEDLPKFMGRDIGSIPTADRVPEHWLTDMVGILPTDPALALAQIESMTYLRNQLLRDSDWASMAHSVELRTPLVDAHLLKQLAPLLGQFRKFSNKTLLAHAPANPLPQDILTRRKTGFGIPVKQWIESSAAVSSGKAMSWAERVIGSYSRSHRS